MYVALKPGVSASNEEIAGKVAAAGDREIGKIARPKHAWVVADMPRTRSGKIMRRVIAGISNFAPVGRAQQPRPALTNSPDARDQERPERRRAATLCPNTQGSPMRPSGLEPPRAIAHKALNLNSRLVDASGVREIGRFRRSGPDDLDGSGGSVCSQNVLTAWAGHPPRIRPRSAGAYRSLGMLADACRAPLHAGEHVLTIDRRELALSARLSRKGSVVG